VARLQTLASRGLVKSLRTAVNRMGFDITREPYHFRFVRLLNRLGIDCVIDVGANTGQFAESLRFARFSGRIISLEPLRAPFDALSASAKNDPSWIPLRFAVSNTRGTLTMNVAGNSASSSVLAMLPTHSDAVPESQYVATENVEATTIDQIVQDYTIVPRRTLLKVDVQGFEKPVLEGAQHHIAEFAAIQMELSLVPLYEGQALMPELVATMDKEGFDLWMTEPAFVDPETGRMYQCDGLFVRRS
jgi:FkbM family methyltransferase